LADNVFNWWLQMMYVFYDEPHYAAVIGQGQAVNFTQIINSDLNRQFVVSVSPNSMQPKDELSEANQAIALYNSGALDPLSLFTKLNYPDPTQTALKVALWAKDPASYMAQFLGVQPPQVMGGQPGGAIPGQPPQPQDMGLGQQPNNNPLAQVPLK
jgi:hypothetical protein